MPHINLIVPDSGPLITLAVAGALDTLLLPDASILIPDMVRHEVIRDLQKAGATAIAQWIRENEGTKVQVISTETYEEYLSLLRVNPLTKSKNRGERAAAEVLERLLERGSRFAILLFEDSAVAKQNFLVRLPENVLILSTSSFFDGFMWLVECDLQPVEPRNAAATLRESQIGTMLEACELSPSRH